MPKQKFRRRPAKLPIAEVNVLPFIDVMLVLLVIFMVTAPMLIQGVEVNLPEVVAAPIDSDPEEEPLVISLKANGRYYLEQGEDSEDPLELTVIINQVQAIKKHNPQLPVYIRGDRQVTYGEIMGLMDKLKGAGVTQVELITTPPEDN